MAIFVKHCLKIVRIDPIPCFQQLECIGIEVLFLSLQYSFICIYNPPSLANDINHTSCLCSFPVILKRRFLWFVISIILISTGVVPINTGSVCSSLFLTCILQNGLTQVVTLSTRGNNCIDLVMVSDALMMLVVDPFAISCDHSSVEFLVSYPSDLPSNSISYCRQFGAADYDPIISFLLDIDWLMLQQQSCSVNEFGMLLNVFE